MIERARTAMAAAFRPESGRRAAVLALAILLELGLLALLLSLGYSRGLPPAQKPTVTTFSVAEEAIPEPPEPEPQTQGAAPPAAASPPQAAAEAVRESPPLPPAAAIIPTETRLPPPPAAPAPLPSPAPTPGRARAVLRDDMAGPANPGPAAGDSQRVGTAPNGEPLYAAAWYREPYDEELRGYLSTASGPGWGLIACRTVPDFRVEDCVALEEYPSGSNINRAILAAAWQFRVRPPRLGGRSLVGAWVRIRIDYSVRPAR